MPGKKQNETDKGGRPSKLDQAFCDKLSKLVGEWDPFTTKGNQARFSDYLRFCTRESIALAMNISRSSLNKYVRGAGGFSDTVKEIIEHWETRRNAFHLSILAYWPEKKIATWIFLSKNFNKFADEIKIGNIEGEVFRFEETNRRLMQMNPDKAVQALRRAQDKLKLVN